MMSTTDSANARIQRDLWLAEQNLRALAERQLGEHVRLLKQLAVRFGGQAVEDLCRQQPTAMEGWTAEQWRTFFDSLQPAPGWVNVESLRAQLERVERERDALRAQWRGPLNVPAQETARLKTASNAPRPATGELSKGALRDLHLTQNCTELDWPTLPSQPPGLWLEHLRLSDEHWPLAALQLWLIAVQGWPVFLEGRRLLTKRNPQDKSRVGDVEGDLDAANLVRVKRDEKILPRDGGEGTDTTSVNAALLTDRGRNLCRDLGWGEPVKSELELLRAAKLSERAIAAGLLFAHYCRLRGYAVRVRPDGNGPLEADVSATGKDEITSVILEVNDEPPASPERWQKLAAGQGQVALCAASPSRRALMVASAQAIGLKGRATDIQTLNSAKDPGPLWAERWE